jgi:diguanylate cyclase (GGDEF)-like protein
MDDEATAGSINPSRRKIDWANYHLACLVILAGPRMGEKFPLSKERSLIGRQRDADISIEDAVISRGHAELVRKPDGAVVLRDLDSKNGTFCNDEKIRERELVEGDLLRVGSSILKYVGPSRFENPGPDAASERARRDGLTGLFNRETFREYTEQNLARCKNLHASLSVGLIDLAVFGKLGAGPEAADGGHILKALGDLLKNAIRPTDILCRYDEDTFGLVLPLTNLMGARIVGERLRGRIASHAVPIDPKGPSTISVGMAERRGGIEEADALILRAGKALQQAKQMGGNLTYCYMETT